MKNLGEEGFLKHARRLGDIASDQTTYILDRAALKAAFDALPKSQQELLHRTIVGSHEANGALAPNMSDG